MTLIDLGEVATNQYVCQKVNDVATKLGYLVTTNKSAAGISSTGVANKIS